MNYCDRGKNSAKVVDFLVNWIKEKPDELVCLRGNHDDVIDWLLTEHCKGRPSEWVAGKPTIVKVFKWWLNCGLDTTLESYGILDPRRTCVPPVEDPVEEWREKVPESHVKFFQNLKMFWENDTHFACHGYFDPQQQLPRDMRFVKSDKYEEILWCRFDPSPSYAWDKIGVFGHTPVLQPVKHDKRRMIDTACFMGRSLTAYCCRTDEFLSVVADERDIVEEWKQNEK